MSAATKWVYDCVNLRELHEYVISHCDAPLQDRLLLMVRHALFVVRERIADAELRGHCVYGDHFDEKTLVRYFSGKMSDEEMEEAEFAGRFCEVCAVEFLAAGRTLTSYAAIFGCDALLRPKTVLTPHFSGEEIDIWFDRTQSKRVKRELLRHLRICRRYREQLRHEAVAARMIKRLGLEQTQNLH